MLLRTLLAHYRRHPMQGLFLLAGVGLDLGRMPDAAGIALGGLYNHFDSKEAVFHAVFLEYHPYKETLPAILLLLINLYISVYAAVLVTGGAA